MVAGGQAYSADDIGASEQHSGTTSGTGLPTSATGVTTKDGAEIG